MEASCATKYMARAHSCEERTCAEFPPSLIETPTASDTNSPSLSRDYHVMEFTSFSFSDWTFVQNPCTSPYFLELYRRSPLLLSSTPRLLSSLVQPFPQLAGCKLFSRTPWGNIDLSCGVERFLQVPGTRFSVSLHLALLERACTLLEGSWDPCARNQPRV